MTDTSDGAGCSSTREFLASTRLVEAAEMPEITSSSMLSGPDLAARAMCSRICSPPPNTRTEILDWDPLRVVLADRNKQLTDSPVGYEHFVRTDGESSLFPTTNFLPAPIASFHKRFPRWRIEPSLHPG